jgi:hypothetical protein
LSFSFYTINNDKLTIRYDIISSFFNKLFFNWTRNSEIDIKHFSYEHVNNSIFVSPEVLFNLSNLCGCLSLKGYFELLILFLNRCAITLYLSAWNYAYFCWRYLLTYCYAASLASFSFLCLNHVKSTSIFEQW